MKNVLKIVIAVAITVTVSITVGIAVYAPVYFKNNTVILCSVIKDAFKPPDKSPDVPPKPPNPLPPKPIPSPDKPDRKGKETEQQSTGKEKLAIKELLERVRVAYYKKDPELMAACFLNFFDAKAAIKQWGFPKAPSDINFKLDDPFIGSTGKDFMTLEVTLLQEKGGELHPHAVRRIKFEKRDGEWKIASGNLFQ